jgi:hypothetical protein
MAFYTHTTHIKIRDFRTVHRTSTTSSLSLLVRVTWLVASVTPGLAADMAHSAPPPTPQHKYSHWHKAAWLPVCLVVRQHADIPPARAVEGPQLRGHVGPEAALHL